jgi:hypothetical protein
MSWFFFQLRSTCFATLNVFTICIFGAQIKFGGQSSSISRILNSHLLTPVSVSQNNKTRSEIMNSNGMIEAADFFYDFSSTKRALGCL